METRGKEHKELTGRQLDGLTAMVALAVFLYVVKAFVPLWGSTTALSEPFLKKDKGMLTIALKIDGQERGVYSMPAGATISDLMFILGRANLPDFDRSRGARRLQTGDEVCLTSVASSPPVVGRMSAAQSLAVGVPVDINTSGFEDLVLVPGIGEKTAARIIGLRAAKGRLRSLDELKELSGIREKKFEKLKKYFFVAP